MLSSASLLPPSSSLVSQLSMSSFLHAPSPPPPPVTAVSVPSSYVSSGVGFSSVVGGSGASSSLTAFAVDLNVSDSACVFTDPLEFRDCNESAATAKDS